MANQIIQQKTCACCGEVKDRTSFSLDSSRPSKLAPYCRICKSNKKFTPYSYEPISGERWQAIPGHEGTYSISSLGRIRRDVTAYRGRRGGLLNPVIGSHGYPVIRLTVKNTGHLFTVHSLIMAAFVGPCPKGHNINHKDGVKSNSVLSNLEYVTPRENTQHAFRIGLAKRGEHHHLAKLTLAQAVEIYKLAHSGIRQKEIASRFNIDTATVSNIKTRQHWSAPYTLGLALADGL